MTTRTRREVLEKGSVAEVRAILRAYIGRVEYDPEANRARVGFLRMPARALVSGLAPESARISMVAGARYAPEKKITGRHVEFTYLAVRLEVARRIAFLLAA